ncbi:uncharacterized protein LOC129290472 isoform X2 [Prosopis cineraria]|uniref:uncharacterized protein LOC129290472 isoform X2 n=1 Tax=Prosopis cineraria TaxID=364024 RepID=UPI00240F9161|nr:uncharacterized protein LOC129290472 isoform X2 [Prosopis cineraria]
MCRLLRLVSQRSLCYCIRGCGYGCGGIENLPSMLHVTTIISPVLCHKSLNLASHPTCLFITVAAGVLSVHHYMWFRFVNWC